MKAAGEEERRLAIDNNQFHEGVPAITVILDGGWSKRSHKHSYNAKSGVGVITGHRTQKLLYIGVKNKDCTACARGSRITCATKTGVIVLPQWNRQLFWKDFCKQKAHMVSGTPSLLVMETALCRQLSSRVYQGGEELLRSWNMQTMLANVTEVVWRR